MPLDPSISLQVGQGVPAPANPLVMAGQAAGLANTLSYNRLVNANADTVQQGLQQTRTHAIGAIGAGLLALPADMPDEDYFHTVVGTIKNARDNGLFDNATAQRYVDNLGMSQGRKHVNDMILGTVIQNLDPSGRATALIGTMANRPNGAVDQYGLQNPLRASQGQSGFTPAGTVKQQLTPAQSISTQDLPVMAPQMDANNQPVLDANGNPVMAPTGAKQTVTGRDVAIRSGQGDLVGAPSFPNNGRYSSPNAPATNQSPAVAPRAPQPQQTPVAANSGLGTTQTPAATTAQTGNAELGVRMGAELTKAADDIPNQRAMLNEMDTALDHIPTGKGQSHIQEYQSWVQSLSPKTAKMLGIDPQNIATGETFKKLANNLALRQAQSLGMGTDASRTSVFGGNPNFDISTLGNKQIIQILKGNADALQAKADAWAKSPQFKTGDYTGFSTTFNKIFDPRAYQFDYMDPAAQQMMKKNAGADWPNLAAKIRAIKPSG